MIFGIFFINLIKTKSIVFSSSRTQNPVFPDLSIDGTRIDLCDSISLLGVTLDSKLTFETHIRNLSVGISRKVGLLRKCKVLYDSNDIVLRSFYSFILPHFEYCGPVWLSAADSHFRLLDRAFSMIGFLIPDLNISLCHRRLVGSICLFFKEVKHLLTHLIIACLADLFLIVLHEF